MDVEWDLLRIVAVTCASAITLFIFKRQIKKVVTDLVVGSDTKEYQDLSVTEVRDRIEERLDRVLK